MNYGLNNNTGLPTSQSDSALKRIQSGWNSAKNIKNGFNEIADLAKSLITGMK